MNPSDPFVVSTILALFAVGAFGHQDACFYLEPRSVCEESGICSITGIPCTDAYIELGKELLIERDEPPIMSVRDQRSWEIMDWYACGTRPSSPSWTMDPSYISFMEKIEMLGTKFQNQFPTIIVELSFIRELVDSAVLFHNNVVKNVVTESEYGHESAKTIEYYGEFAHNHVFHNIDSYMFALLNYVYALDFLDPMRLAIVTQMIPYVHAWLRIRDLLAIPLHPYKLWIETLLFMTKYDPLYPKSETENTWLIPVVNGLRYDLLLPLVADETEGIPLYVLEEYTESNLHDIVKDISSKLIAHILNYRSGRRDPEFFQFIRISLFVLRFAGADLEPMICTDMSKWWLEYFRISAVEMDQGWPRINLIHILRICGYDYFSLQDRVMTALPVLVGPRETPSEATEYTNGTLPMPLNKIRAGVKFTWAAYGSQTGQHAKFLTKYISAKLRVLPARPRQLHALGSAIALLVIEGDPYGMMHDALRNGTIPDLYLNSVSVRRGFCEVMNCVAFDFLFQKSELPDVMRILKSTPVLNREIMRRRAEAVHPSRQPDSSGLASLFSALRLSQLFR